MQVEHAATIAYVKTPIGAAQFDMSTYYAMAGDVSALQIVNMAQIDYLKDYIARNNPPYAALPILSAAAPFKGGRNGPGDFTFVKQGNIAINNAADLYLYPNTLQVVRVSGDIVRQWLEKTAEQFRLIDPTQVAPQDLVDTTFPTFNFDVLYAEGNTLRYEIDVTKPVGSRIVNLTYKGARSIPPPSSWSSPTTTAPAAAATSRPGRRQGRHRAAGAGRQPRCADQLHQAPSSLDLATYGLDRSWRFVKLAGQAGPVVFASVPGTLAMATAHGVGNVSVHDATPDPVTQLSRYKIDLTQ